MSTGMLVRSVWFSSLFALCSCSDEPSLPAAQTTGGQAAAAGPGVAGNGAGAGGAAAASGGPSAGLGAAIAGAAAVSGGAATAGAAATSGGAGSSSPGTAGTAASGAAGSSANGTAGTAAGGASGSGATSGSGGLAAPSGGPTFTRVWTEILMLKGCSGQYCHGSGMGGLAMKNKREAYDSLVNKPAAGPACAATGGMRVKPMDPDASLLLQKMNHPMPSCGDVMPIGAKLAPNCVSQMPQVCTTEQELGLVRDWILAGAKDD